MGVKPVEYVKDSSTQGFAVAGDEKSITQTNANTIQKDVNQGNTKDLDNAQDKYLSSLVDEDTIDYNPDEQKNIGANQIDTEGEDGEDLSKKDDTAASNGAVAASATSAAAGAAAAIYVAAAGRLCNNGVIGWVLAGVATALSITNLSLSIPSVFDPNLGERKSQTDNAEQNNQTIQAYYDTLSGDMDEMVNDSERYKELLAGKTQSDTDMITELGVLQAELNVYLSQGDTEKAAEIQAKIDEIKNGAKDDPAGAELADIKEGLETYASHYNESLGVAESGATVSEFLRDGNPMSKKAQACAYLQAIAALACMTTVVKPSFVFDGPISIIATLMFVASGIMFGTASKLMFDTAGSEGDAGDAGNQMNELVGQLNENIEAQGGFTEETSAGYAEGDAEYTQTTQKTQEGVDKALKDQQGRLNPPENNPPTPTPTPTPSPTPNTEPEPEEPAA